MTMAGYCVNDFMLPSLRMLPERFSAARSVVDDMIKQRKTDHPVKTDINAFAIAPDAEPFAVQNIFFVHAGALPAVVHIRIGENNEVAGR